MVRVIVDVCVIPIGVGVSLSAYVAACERIFLQHGLEVKLHATGTDIAGEWDVVFAALKQCHQTLHEMGAPRINTTLKLGTRTDRQQSMAERIQSVEEKLSGP